jgi:hypothetical protein
MIVLSMIVVRSVGVSAPRLLTRFWQFLCLQSYRPPRQALAERI